MKYFFKKTKDELSIKKIILIIVLLAGLVTICMQKDDFIRNNNFMGNHKIAAIEKSRATAIRKDSSLAENDDERFVCNAVTENMVSLKGKAEIRQEFTAQDDALKMVKLKFYSPTSYQTKGQVHIDIEDQNGKTIAESELDASLALHDGVTRFTFDGSNDALNSNETVTTIKSKTTEAVEINKGDKYVMVISGDNITAPGEFAVYMSSEAVEDTPAAVINGKEAKDGISVFDTIQYNHFTYLVFAIFAVAILLGIILILIPLESWNERINRKRRKNEKPEMDLNKFLLRIMFFLTPFFSFFILGKIANLRTMAVISQMLSIKGLLNFMIIGFIWWLIYTICNRTKLTIIITTLIMFIFGMINYMLMVFRDSPFIFSDIQNVGTALQVAGSYQLTFNKSSLWAILFTLIWICVAIYLKSYKGLPWKKRVAALLLCAAWGFTTEYVIFQSDVIENVHANVSGFKPKWNYKKNGYVLSFFVTIKTSFVQKPKDYSVDHVKELTKGFESDTAVKLTKATKQSPNIIVIMNEAYSDLQAVGKFNTNQDYMPYFRSLKENTVKGVMHASIFGGTTANSEFEFLTGNTMAFLPYHSVAYANMIKDKIPSLTWNLKAQGYTGNIAFHPGMKNSYNRDKVYDYLGFDKFISVEDMDDPETIRSYVSDKADFDTLIDEYEAYKKSGSTAPYYMYNVTIQNHGAYKQIRGVVNAGIRITDDEVREEEAEQYLNLIKTTDDQLKRLIDYFKKQKEPTIVVMYGDHQPRVGDSFYNSLYGKSEDSLSLEEIDKKYQIPFMMWANYDIPEEQNVEISDNYMSSYMLQLTGGKLTGYNKYLLNLRKTLPVLSYICYKDKDGNIYDVTDKKSKYAKLVQEYQNVQYNGFNDKNNRLDDFFYLKTDK